MDDPMVDVALYPLACNFVCVCTYHHHVSGRLAEMTPPQFLLLSRRAGNDVLAAADLSQVSPRSSVSVVDGHLT